MAKSLDNGGAEKPVDLAKEKAATQREPSKLMPRAVLALADALGVMENPLISELVPPDGEHEIDYVTRTLPLVAEAGKARIDALVADINAANRRLASQRGATTKAKARIVELEEADKPRALGPLAAVLGDPAEEFTVDDLLTAIDAGNELVLAFSDGRAELRGVKPMQVSVAAFRFTRGRLHFIEQPLEVTGPDGGATLAGVALLIDGEQAAWSPMAQPISIGAGQTINLAGSVIFG